MSDNGQPDPEFEIPDPKVIEEAIMSALNALGIKPEDMSNVFVQQVSGVQMLHMMHALAGPQESSWIPRFMSDIVIQNSAISVAARSEMSLEELARDEGQLTELVESMPELNLQDYDAYLVWKQETEQLIVVVDRAVKRWRDNAGN